MSKHTPGPWVIDHETRPTEVCTIHNTTHRNGWVYVRGEIGYWSADEDENMANARLIAAAPDLLQALKVISVWAANGTGWKDLEDIRRLADESVNKATGGSDE